MSTFKYNDIDISMTATGKFQAVIDGKNRTAASMRDMEKLIEQSAAPAYVLLQEYGRTIQKVRLLGKSGDKFRVSGTSSLKNYWELYNVDEDVIANVKALHDKHSEINRQIDEQLQKLVRYTHDAT